MRLRSDEGDDFHFRRQAVIGERHAKFEFKI
jgi:hypothetical protein